jgi:hypothetical protein
MLNFVVPWLQAHPLQGVATLAGIAVICALTLIPGLALIGRHGHPRC